MSSPIGRSKHYSLKKGTHINVIFVLKLRANGRNIVGQKLPHCWMLHAASVCTPVLLEVVTQSLKKGQTFVLLRDRQSVAQQCYFRLYSSSNIVRATHANYTWSLKPYGLYPSHDALQLPKLMGLVASACT